MDKLMCTSCFHSYLNETKNKSTINSFEIHLQHLQYFAILKLSIISRERTVE